MNKRSKWTKHEDDKLKSIIINQKDKLEWEIISDKMKKINIKKSSKQCRERWFHQLDPNLKKDKWSDEENTILFDLHKKLGSKWKEIAEFFKGRTDNCIKNQFFSLIRKSLRNARKILGKVSNTISVNKIRPKVLSDFMRKKITIVFPDRLKKKNLQKEKIVFMNDFVVKFVFNKFHQLLTKLDERDVYVIEKSLEFLRSLNKNYLKKKKIKKDKKNRMKNMNKISIEKNIGFNKINHNKRNLDVFSNKKILKKLNLDPKPDDSLLINNLIALENKKKELEKVHDDYLSNPRKILNERKNFTQNIKNIGEISYMIFDVLNKTSSKDFDETFSVQSKKNKSNFFNNSNFFQKSLTIDDNEFKIPNQLPENLTLSNIYLNKKNKSVDLMQSFINTKNNFFSPSHFAPTNIKVKEKTPEQNRFNEFYNKKFDQSKIFSKFNNNNGSNNTSVDIFNMKQSQTSNFSNFK